MLPWPPLTTMSSETLLSFFLRKFFVRRVLNLKTTMTTTKTTQEQKYFRCTASEASYGSNFVGPFNFHLR